MPKRICTMVMGRSQGCIHIARFAISLLFLVLHVSYGYLQTTCRRRPTRHLAFGSCGCRRCYGGIQTHLKSTTKEQKALALDQVFNDDVTNQISRDVSRHIAIPLVPRPVVSYVMSQVLNKVKTDLSEHTMELLLVVLRAEATPSPYDDYTSDELDALAKQMADELAPSVNIPMMQNKPEAKQGIVQKLVRSVLSGLTTSQQDQRMWAMNTATQLVLQTPEDRRALAESIQKNWSSVIPGIPKTLQTSLIQRAVDVVADTITAVIPPDLMQALRGERSGRDWEQMKSIVIEQVCDAIDLGILSVEQKQSFVSMMVDLLMRQYVDGTDAELLLMAGDLDRQEASLTSQQSMLQRELRFSQRRYERETASIKAKLQRVRQQIRQVRRKRPWYRRLFRMIFRRK